MLRTNWSRKRKNLKVKSRKILFENEKLCFFFFEDESSWIEVFIDILLSMYTKKQHEVRTMIKKIYQHIVPHLTENALKLMLQVRSRDQNRNERFSRLFLDDRSWRRRRRRRRGGRRWRWGGRRWRTDGNRCCQWRTSSSRWKSFGRCGD